MRVHVLGCGPAGLLVAHAALQRGHAVTIVSKKVKSPIGGAQFLHSAIPELTEEEPDGSVEFIHWGDEKNYAKKVYQDPSAPTSWGNYSGDVPIWNMRKAYNELWDRYNDNIVNREVTTQDLAQHRTDDTHLIFSTIPRPVLCTHLGQHHFKKQEVWLTYEQGKPAPNLILYNGDPEYSWYRYSALFSWYSTEWPHEPPNAQTKKISKPLSHGCDCFPDIHKLGRYGRWEKGVLIHDAYWQAGEIIAAKEVGHVV